MPTRAEVKAYFDQVAPEWDRLRQSYYGEEVIEKALTAAGLGDRQADVLVDVGCGTGFLSAGLAAKTDTVIGIDDSAGMLERARANLHALGLSNVELWCGTVEHLPLAGGIADATFANMVLHHAPDPQRMVQEEAAEKAGSVGKNTPKRALFCAVVGRDPVIGGPNPGSGESFSTLSAASRDGARDPAGRARGDYGHGPSHQ